MLLRVISLLLIAGSLGAASSKTVGVPSVPLAIMRYQANGTLIALPVRVNGSRMLSFVLDSGARHTIVDRAIARDLRLKVVAGGHGSGVGRGTFRQDRAASIMVSIGTIPMKVAEPWIIDLRHVNTNVREDGLIGADMLERYVVRINPIAQTIAFYDPKTFVYTGTGAAVPLHLSHDRLYAEMVLTIGQRSVTHRMRVDTGSEDAASDNFVRQSPGRRKSLQGVGLGTPYYDYSGVFDSVRIGPYTIRRSWGASNDHPAFGMEILRRFSMTFDVAAGRLYLEPNRHFHEPVPSPH